MKKICLSFVLAIVSIFSISAQTNITSTDNTGLMESVKADSDGAKTKTDSVKTIVEASETDFSVKQKLQVSDSANVSDLLVLPFEKNALGSFSTGNLLVDSYITEFSALFNVDPLLIYAQMSQESSFKAKATSPKGASGFMQLMPATAKRFGVTNIYNPEQNIKAGIKYMRWLLDKFGGDTRLALAGYNAGEGAVIKYGNQIPPYRETQNYVAKIMTHYEQISNQKSVLTKATDIKTNEIVASAF
jgi:soluble lytic murein transglycosylase-like protein